jgi:hypothetical protein
MLKLKPEAAATVALAFDAKNTYRAVAPMEVMVVTAEV